MIYDIVHMGEQEMRQKIRSHFYHHKDIQDARIIDMLVEKGYIDLEDTLLQHKQKNHLMLLLEGPLGTDLNKGRLSADASIEEQFQRWIWEESSCHPHEMGYCCFRTGFRIKDIISWQSCSRSFVLPLKITTAL